MSYDPRALAQKRIHDEAVANVTARIGSRPEWPGHPDTNEVRCGSEGAIQNIVQWMRDMDECRAWDRAVRDEYRTIEANTEVRAGLCECCDRPAISEKLPGLAQLAFTGVK